MNIALARSRKACGARGSTSRRRPRPGFSERPTTRISLSLTGKRVVFARDQDFLRLHAAGAAHFGIACRRKDTHNIGEILQGLILIWEYYDDADDLSGVVEFLWAGVNGGAYGLNRLAAASGSCGRIFDPCDGQETPPPADYQSDFGCGICFWSGRIIWDDGVVINTKEAPHDPPHVCR